VIRGEAAVRLARWLDEHRRGVLVASLAVVVAGGLLAARLPVHGDFSYLLPENAASVVQLRAVERRARVAGTVMVMVESDDRALRARAAQALFERLSGLEREGVADLSRDDHAARRYAWDNRFLFASLADLTEARDALLHAVQRSNPLYVSLEDEDAHERALERLRARLKEAEQKRDTPEPFVSRDGRLQMLLVRTTFPSGTIGPGELLIDEIRRRIDLVRSEFGPGVRYGVAGDVVTAVAEHRSILDRMLLATVLTVGVCLLGLLLYFRSPKAVAALAWSLAVGVLATFGLTRITIGHLNIASAFLSSIVVGNGINFGILLCARHLEERRRGHRGVEATARAVAGTLHGTLAAALAASVAYGSLVVTDFRGFRHFGMIGGMGMLLCWASAYTVLPAALAVAERRGLEPGREPAIGPWLARLMPRRVGVTALLLLATTSLAGVVTWRFLRHDPYESNFRNLRSTCPELDEARRWLDRSDREFGTGISGGFVLLVPRREQAREVAALLRARDEGKAKSERFLGRLSGLDDLMPADQPTKLALLDEIRRTIDRESKKLSDADRAELLRLRPPDGLRAVVDGDVPGELAWPYTENDGTRGRLILADAGVRYDIWIASDLERFTREFRAIDLGPDVLAAGAMFVLADVLHALHTNGAKATLAALCGAALAVWLVIGVRRHGAVTLACGASGALWMLACAAALGLKANFLDFVALPITIGIGIDYAVNIVARDRLEPSGGARGALATTGGAVFLCSFTTIVGYGSLLLSQSRGIRSFGLAALLGEVACLTAAFTMAPVLLALRLDAKGHRWHGTVGEPGVPPPGSVSGANAALADPEGSTPPEA
jgi:uncharacterized protein